ncbi:MAG: hypothetical protein ACRDMV_10700 [Streptosporangiales bacterium]
MTDVPEKTSAAVVMDALETAGKATDFAESGVAWGNHEVKAERNLPKGTAGTDEAPSLSWTDLTGSKTLRRITLRLTPADYARVHMSARRADTSIQDWCVQTLLAATEEGA